MNLLGIHANRQVSHLCLVPILVNVGEAEVIII